MTDVRTPQSHSLRISLRQRTPTGLDRGPTTQGEGENGGRNAGALRQGTPARSSPIWLDPRGSSHHRHHRTEKTT